MHIAIIMDGNGRWAARRGLPRSAGHQEGARAVGRVVESAPKYGVRRLTLFAFSADNWRRPDHEVQTLMSLLRRYIRTELHRLIETGTCLKVIGRRDRLPPGLSDEIAAAERTSASGTRLALHIAIDYSSREAIANAAASWTSCGSPSRAGFGQFLAVHQDYGVGREVDLLIRTGGEKRLSDFLLWESAYAELCFVDTPWPDFGEDELRKAIADFHSRERRFGGLPNVPTLAVAEISNSPQDPTTRLSLAAPRLTKSDAGR